MTIIRLITNNYLQILHSLGSSCGESGLDIALQNPLPSLPLAPSCYILLLPSSLSTSAPHHHHPTIHLLSTLLRFNHFPSPHFRPWPPLICPLLSWHPRQSLAWPSSLSPATLSLLNFPHPVYLFAWLSQHCRSPFACFLSHERLSIPSASRLIYHPNGGYRREEVGGWVLGIMCGCECVCACAGGGVQQQIGVGDRGTRTATFVQVQPANGVCLLDQTSL